MIRYPKHFIDEIELVYDAKKAPAVVIELINIETAACLKVEAIKYCSVSVFSVSTVNELFSNRLAKTHSQIFINKNTLSAPMPVESKQ